MAAEEEAAGRDVTSAVVNNIDITGINQPMAVFMEWTAPTSGGVYPENNLTRLEAMGACMYSTSARVIRTPTTSRRFSKAGNMMRRS